MIYESSLTDWINGNISQLENWELIQIAAYFEKGKQADDIIYDLDDEDDE